MTSYGTISFFYSTLKNEYTITSQTRPLFGKSQTKLQTFHENVKETDEQLWDRINTHIKNNNWEAVSIESIYKSSNKSLITNKNVIGYRIFYKKHG